MTNTLGLVLVALLLVAAMLAVLVSVKHPMDAEQFQIAAPGR